MGGEAMVGGRPRPTIQVSIEKLIIGGDGQGGISKPTVLTQLVELFEEVGRQSGLVPN
jgi:hypothetical protein